MNGKRIGGFNSTGSFTKGIVQNIQVSGFIRTAHPFGCLSSSDTLVCNHPGMRVEGAMAAVGCSAPAGWQRWAGPRSRCRSGGAPLPSLVAVTVIVMGGI